MMPAPRETLLRLHGLNLAALQWPAENSPRVLALHGWLDNAASFVPMAEHLSGLNLVAVDFPGHGHSDWYSAGRLYHFVDYLRPVLQAADALGWNRFHLLGHSLGGAVATLLTAGAPERVQSLTVIEGLGPLTTPEAETCKGLRRSLLEKDKPGSENLRLYPDVEAAVAARARQSDLSEEVSRTLVERSVRAVEGGYQWRSDPRLKRTSPLRMTEGQVLNLLEHIEAPTTLITATPVTRETSYVMRQGRLEAVKHCRWVELPGHHHLHMETPAPVAAAFQQHLKEFENGDES